MPSDEMKRSRDLYRCWMGFRFFFRGTSISLNKNLVPVIRTPKEGDRKGWSQIYAMRNVVGSKKRELFPLFFAGLGIQNRGEIWHPFDSISESTVKKMHALADRNVQVLARLHEEYASIADLSFGKKDLLETLLAGEISVPAAAMWRANQEDDEPFHFESMSLRLEQISDVFEKAVVLERRNQFFTRYAPLCRSAVRNSWSFGRNSP